MTFLKQPLLHFIFAGFFLFWLYGYVGNTYVETLGNENEKTVSVDEAALRMYLQHQSAVNEITDISQLSESRLKELIDGYVREEVLYREALALDLEKEDYSIRQRVVEKMQFALDNSATAELELSEEALQQFYQQRLEDYRVDAVYDFTHIFFDSHSRGEKQAEDDAAAFMESHTLGEVTAQNAENYSDRFPFLQNYGGRTRDFVINNFSETFVYALDRLDPSPRWVGPIASPFGFHVVQLRSRQESYLPALDAIRPRVEDDYVYESIRRGSSILVDALVSEYEVIVDLGQGENVSSSDTNN